MGDSIIANLKRQGDGMIQPLYARIDFPRFEGHKPLEFNYKAKQLFRYHRTTKIEKAVIASTWMVPVV